MTMQLYLISWVLVGFSIANAAYCFMKRKNYRMFDAKPNVRVLSRDIIDGRRSRRRRMRGELLLIRR